jgi:RNA polymerase-associated protein CTR9
MLASLRASHRPALTDKEYATDKEKAREAFERVKKEVTHLLGINGSTNSGSANSGSANGGPKLTTHRTLLIEDVEMHLELGQLWQSDSVEKAIQAYEQAVALLKRRKGASAPDPRIVNNIAALHHIDGKYESARTLYEQALGVFAASGTDDDASDAVSTTILYNLAKVYEDSGESTMAKEAYDKLLTRHPEYIDGTFSPP